MKAKILLWAMLIATAAYAANELNTSVQTTFTKNGSTYQLATTKQTTITGDFAYDVIHSIGTNGTAVSFGASLPIGTVIIVNITTNSGRTISYGTNAAALFGRVNPGDSAKFNPRDGGTNLWIQLDTATNAVNNVRVFGVSQ